RRLRGSVLERLEPAGIGRRIHHRRVGAAVPVERVHLAAQREGRRRRPVGGQHPRVGDLVAAPAVQLRPAPRDPLRAAGVRCPPRARRAWRARRPGRGGGASGARGGPRRQPGAGRRLVTADAPALTATAVGHAAAGGHAQRGISNPILGMILFITSEVMFFSGLFAAYFATRAANTSPTHPWPPGPFQNILNPLSLIMVATIILITSSFTCQFA